MKINKRHPVIVKILQYLNIGVGRCKKCGLPWNHCSPRIVKVTDTGNIMFAVCTHCWKICSHDELLQLHENAYSEHERDYSLKELLGKVNYQYYKTKAGL